VELTPGYKQTEVGLIPADWEVQAIHEFATIKTGPFGTLLKASEYAEGDGVPLISVGEIREGFLRITDHTPRVPKTVIRRLPQYVLRQGDIVFGRKGGVERSALIRGNQAGWFLGSDGISIRPAETCNQEYLALQFQSVRVQRWLIQHAIGTTMPSLNQQILRDVVIPLPQSKAEQEAIAEALTDADALIESLEQLLAKKRLLKQGAMQELLTGKKRLPGFETVCQFWDSEVGKIPSDWELRSLRNLGSVGTGNTPPTDDPTNYGDEFPFVSPADMGRTKYVSQTEKRLSPKGFEHSRKFPAGSILFVCIGSTIGKCGIASEWVAANQQLNVVTPSIEVVSEYLYYALSVTAPRVKALAGEQAVPIVNKSQFSETLLLLPKVKAEQLAIAVVLADMDSEITDLEAKLTKARHLKQAMMQELLTGKIRLL
jgi:type I restriction enzyme S subunit